MTVNVIPNTFWKKDVIAEGVNVTSAFPDLANSSDTSFKLAGGNTKQNAFVLSGSVPQNPTYGAGELRRGTLRLYSSAVETQYNREPPSLVGYAIDKNIQIREGGYSFALSGGTGTTVVGDELAVYNSIPHTTVPTITEEFEGAIEELGTINRMGNNNVIAYSDPYITRSDVKKILKDEGHDNGSRRMKYIDQMLMPVTYRMAVGGPAIDPETGADREEGSDLGGTPKRASLHSQTTAIRRYDIEFTGQAVGGGMRRFKFVDAHAGNYTAALMDAVGRQFLKRTHSIPSDVDVKWGRTTTAPATLDGNPAASKGNTILSDFYATRDFSNPYDATTTNPMILSGIELTTEKALNGGQSLRLYHNWGYSENNPVIQNQLGVSGNLNPQCARASLYNIPFPPMPHEVGMSTVSATDSTSNFGDARAVMPEIQVALNVTKLEPNVILNVQTGDNYVSGNAAHLYYANATPANTTFLRTEASLLRCVAVTFSNYKPKSSHTTLDKFLDYGLTNFYNHKNTDNVVGGVIFSRWNIDGVGSSGDGSGVGANMYAYPLPVTMIPQVGTGTSGGESLTLASGGMARINGGSGDLANCDSLIWGLPAPHASSSPEDDDDIRYVELPMNSWVTMRCFTDIFQYNNTGSATKRIYAASSSTNPTVASGTRGVPMRVIFETEGENDQIVTEGAASAPFLASGTVVDPTTRNLPFLDIFFPAGDGTNGRANYSFFDNPKFFPKHMTIWTQNYCWVSGGTTELPWKYGDNGVLNDLYPDGASRELEVFVDSIKLLNYGPTVKSVNQNDVMNFTPMSHFSPVGVGFNSTDAIYRHSWVNSAPIDITGNIAFTSGDEEATIVDEHLLDATMLDMHGTVTVTSTNAGTLGTNAIASFDGLHSFVMTGGALDDITESVVFTAPGTLDPYANRANFFEYNTGQNVVFGFDSVDDIPLATTSGQTGYVLANDYTTYDWDAASTDSLLPRKAVGQVATASGAIFSRNYTNRTLWPNSGASGYKLVAGGDMFIGGPGLYDLGAGTSPFNNVSGASFLVDDDGTALVGDSINLGTGTNPFLSSDGLRQKGFMYFNVSGSGSAPTFPPPLFIDEPVSLTQTAWGKRENILCSTKIVTIPAMVNMNSFTDDNLSDNQIIVQDPSIFNFENKNERYVIYLMAGNPGSGTAAYNTIPNAFKKLRIGGLVLAGEPEGNTITFTESLRDSSGAEPEVLIMEQNIDRLWISPEKLWLTMMFDTPATLGSRSYNSFCTINQTPSSGTLSAASGTTYNESEYSYNLGAVADGGESGFYKNLWELTPIEGNSTLITDVDFGFENLDSETGEGGYLFYGGVVPSSYNYYNFNDIGNNYKAGDNMPMVLYLSPDIVTAEESATFYSDDYTTESTYVPTMYWEFVDNPPLVEQLEVGPLHNLTDEGVDLYELTTEDINALNFRWNEGNADDVWYRMLMVSESPIVDKYHGATMWLPLNESVTNYAASPTYKVYNPSTQASATLANSTTGVGDDVRGVLEGQAGFAPQLSTTEDGKITVPYATNAGLKDKTEFTLVVHWTPSAADQGNVRYVVTQSDDYADTEDNFHLYKNASDKIVVELGDDIALTGSKTITCDGSQPASIILTLNTGSAHPNKAHLYVDGAWQDSSTGTTNAQGNNDFVLGGRYVASTYTGSTGLVEEVLIYDKAHHVPNVNTDFVLATDDYPDYTGSTSAGVNNITYNARLLVADYHNFRGYNRHELGWSNQTSWRTTTI